MASRLISFETACRVTGVIFVLFSTALLVFTGSWVQQYIAQEAHWPIAIDTFRLVAASDLLVGTLLLAVSHGELAPKARCWVSFNVAACIGVLTGVHWVLLAPLSGAPSLWQPMLYVDTLMFGSVTLYWIVVTTRVARQSSLDRAAA